MITRKITCKLDKKHLKYLLIFGAYIVLMVFMQLFLDNLINSDDSSELILANLLAKENKLLTDSWYYSTEIKVINEHLVYALLFKFIGNWHWVRVLGNGIIYALIVASAGYFCKYVKLSNYFYIFGTILLLPFSIFYFNFVLKGTYYAVYIIVSFIILGIMLKTANSNKIKQNVLSYIFAGILSILSCMNGLRQLMVLFIPLLCAVFTVWVLSINKKTETSQAVIVKRIVYFTIWVTICALLGYLINVVVLARLYKFKSYNSMNWTTFQIDALFDVLNGWLCGFGFKGGKDKRLFSAYTIGNICAICLFLFNLFCVIKNMIKIEEQKIEYQMLSLFYFWAFLAFAGIYTFTDMTYSSRYNLPVFIFSFPVMFLYIENLCIKNKLKYILIYSLFALVCVCSFMNYHEQSQEDINSERRVIAQLLIDNGYTEGYSRFRNANIMTELTNGEMEVWCWNEDNADIGKTYQWLQLSEHEYKKPEGKIWVLFTKEQSEKYELDKQRFNDNIIYRSDSYIVYIFNSYEDLFPEES